MYLDSDLIFVFEPKKQSDLAKYTVNGTPKVTDAGVRFVPGNSDYVSTKIRFTGQADSITIEPTLTPYFNYDINTQYVFFDTASGSAYRLYKKDSGDDYKLVLYLGNTFLGTIASSVYGPYWNENSENKIIIAGTTGSTVIYLNKKEIGSFAGAWSPINSQDFYIGSKNDGSNSFNGLIKSIRAWKRKFTKQEVNDSHNGRLYTIPKPLLYLKGNIIYGS